MKDNKYTKEHHMHVDVAIIGGGPGGYVAAIRAAQLGKKVTIIEKEELGGVCLNWGCIPTKSLLKSAELYSKIKNSSAFGIKVEGLSFDIKSMVDHSRSVVNKLRNGLKFLMKKNGIEVVKGIAKLLDKNIIEISDDNHKSTLTAQNIILATGSSSRIINGFEPDGNRIITHKEAMNFSTLPKSITIVGSGAIGIEFASFFNSLGVNVTILEAQASILGLEDKDISIFAHKSFEKKKIKIITSVKLVSHEESESLITVSYEQKNKLYSVSSEYLMIAAGVIPNSKNLGLENTKIETDSRGHVITNQYLQTSESNIYAIGDIVSGPSLAHKASHEGIIAAEHLAGEKVYSYSYLNVPSCTYSSPQIASVGLTEQSAIQQGLEIKIGNIPFSANSKAIASEETEGFIKVIFDCKTGELLGAHMIGEGVTELIHGYVVAKNLESTNEELINMIFPHPTLSESILEAALAAYGNTIHT